MDDEDFIDGVDEYNDKWETDTDDDLDYDDEY